MPYDAAKDPWRGSAISPAGLGRSGAVVAPHDGDDLPRYARIRVFAPATLASAQIRVLPVGNADAAPLVLALPVGVPVVLEYMVRRVFATGTTAGLDIHTVN